MSESKHLGSVDVPIEQSFQLEIKFSKAMDTTLLTREFIGLVHQDGEMISIQL